MFGFLKRDGQATQQAAQQAAQQARVLEQLRELRVTIQDLQLLLASVRIGETDLCASAGYITHATQRIEDLIKAIEKAMAEGGLGGREQLCHITNLWNQVCGVPCLKQPDSKDINP